MSAPPCYSDERQRPGLKLARGAWRVASNYGCSIQWLGGVCGHGPEQLGMQPTLAGTSSQSGAVGKPSRTGLLRQFSVTLPYSNSKIPIIPKTWVIDHRGAGIGPTVPESELRVHSNRLGPVGQLRPRSALYEHWSPRAPLMPLFPPPQVKLPSVMGRSSYRREGAATYLSLHPSFPITRNQELHLDSYRPTGCTPWWMPHSSIQGGASRAATSLI